MGEYRVGIILSQVIWGGWRGRGSTERGPGAASRRPKGRKQASNQNGWIIQERATRVLGLESGG